MNWKCLTCKSDAKKNIYECGTLHDVVPHTWKELGCVSFWLRPLFATSISFLPSRVSSPWLLTAGLSMMNSRRPSYVSAGQCLNHLEIFKFVFCLTELWYASLIYLWGLDLFTFFLGINIWGSSSQNKTAWLLLNLRFIFNFQYHKSRFQRIFYFSMF